MADGDRDAVVEILKDDVVKKTYMVPDIDSEELADQLFRRLRDLSQSPEHYTAGIYRGGDLIGFINDVEIEGGRVELGYALHPRCFGQGYATEAFRAAVEALLGQGIQEVCAGAFEENAASFRVMEKAGLSRTRREEDIAYRGKTYHCVYYSISGSDAFIS